MRKFLLLVVVALVVWRFWPIPHGDVPRGQSLPVATAPAGLRFSLIKTGDAKTLEGFAVAGGSLFKTVTINHVAVLVEHPQGRFLFDTGLGTKVDSQFEDMPAWAKPSFKYENLHPAVGQLEAAGAALPERIFLSHAHWDHASALVDFPQAEVWLPTAERTVAASGQPPAYLPSQLHSATTKWRPFEFTGPAYAGFDSSLDVFGDGSVVMLPLPGHTPGSTGMLVTLADGKRYFFIGDTVWNLKGIIEPAPKFSLASMLVDADRRAVWQTVLKVRSLLDANPALIVVPAHDGAVDDTLAYFPKFVGGETVDP